MEQRITLVTLGVRDLAAARRFYVEALGWKPSGGNEHVTFIECGGVVLSLFGRDALAEDAHTTSDGSGFRAVALAHNVRDRETVDRVLLEVQAL